MAKQKENDLGMATTVSLSFAAEASLWLFIITVTLLIEFSTFSFLPAYHAAAGLMLLRVAHVHIIRLKDNIAPTKKELTNNKICNPDF